MVQPYSSYDSATALKSSNFILSEKSNYHLAVNGSPRFTYAYVDIIFSRCDIATKVC